MSGKKLKSFIFLGKHFALHFLGKLFPKRRGLKEFKESYQKDGIFAVPPEFRMQMPDYSHCMTCKLCDSVCPELLHNTHFLAPSYVVTSFSRQLTNFNLFNQKTCWESCNLCEQACPKDVPLVQVFQFINKGKQLLQKQSA